MPSLVSFVFLFLVNTNDAKLESVLHVAEKQIANITELKDVGYSGSE